MNTEEGMSVRYIKRNGDAGVDSLRNYTEINPETVLKNGWAYDTDSLPDNFRDTCINKDLAEKNRPETDVPFEERTVTLGGKESKVVVPKFESNFDAQLTDDLIKSTDANQFTECNAQLRDAIKKDPQLKNKFTVEQLEDIELGDIPDGFTWHHNEEVGKMQLVDTVTHNKTGHTGGRNIWGGGSDAR